LRQIITFLVRNGFSLIEVRKLYIDEMIEFYNILLEQLGAKEKTTNDPDEVKRFFEGL